MPQKTAQFFFVFIVSILCIQPTAILAKTIQPFTAKYTVKLHSLPAGTITRKLTINTNGHYQMSALTESSLPILKLTIFEKSTGQWTHDGPRPFQYSYRHQWFKKIRTINTSFNWQKLMAYTSKNKRHYSVKIPKNAQDKLSFHLAIRQDLLNHNKTFLYYVVDRHHLYDYEFKKAGEETLETPLGNLRTIKMQRSNIRKGDDVFTFWLAPKYDYLLVKIIDSNNGNINAEAKIEEYKPKA